MGAAVGAVAAARARARREVLEHFRLAGATRPESAVDLPEVRLIGERQIERWEERGVLRAAAGGGYWLDEAAYAVDEAARRRRKGIVLAVVFAVLAAGVLFTQLASRSV